jgi:lysophospholipase L1-like esterase
VPVIARRLSETRQVTTTNLGIPGAVIGPEIQQLGQRYGRFIPGNFIEHELPNLPRDATVVTVFAGGNDVNAIGAAAEGGAAGADLRGFLDTQVQQFRASYDALIAGIRQRAPAARIVVANLPNLAALPYASEYSLLRQQGMQRLSVAFSTEVIDRLAGEGVPVVDLLCDGRVYDAGRYSSDGFHPNDAGYSLMAELLLEGILRGLPAPATSCGPMQVVPSL